MNEMMDPTAYNALNQYDIGTVTSTEYQHQGYSNCSHRIDTDQGRFLFREFLSKLRPRIEQEFLLLSALEGHGCPTAHPISSKCNSTLTEVDGRLFGVFPFLEGAEPPLTPATARDIGRTAGHLSLMPSVAGFDAVLNGSWVNALRFVETHGAGEIPAAQQAFLRKEGQRFKQDLPTDLPSGIIHADLFPDNVLFKDNQLVAVLDFEEAAVDTLLLDLGIAINGFCFPDNTLDHELMDALIDGYKEHRPLSKREKDHRSLYIRYGLFGILYWHFSHPNATAENRQSTRIEELMQRYRKL